MVELERRGIPTVLFTAQTFVHDAHRSAASFGLAGLPLAVVPLPFTNQTPADIHGMAERAFDQVRAGLTRPVEAPKAVERPPLDERLRYDGDDLLDAWGRMQADFLVLVNGPKGRAASLNSGMCALGPGAPSASNTVLGRAVRLTMMNVGHTYVGVSDMDTIGSPLKYSLCCAENEAESPWEPYHVTRGFAPDASTITVHFVYGICELHDFRSTTPEHLVQVFAAAANNVAQVGTGLWLIGRRADPRSKTEEKEHNTLFICPEHAQIFAKAGWGRREIQAALYRAARLPFRTMILNKGPKAMEVAHPELAWLADHPDLPVPIVEDPTCFDIAVVGAAAGRGAYFYGAGEPVTMPVED